MVCCILWIGQMDNFRIVLYLCLQQSLKMVWTQVASGMTKMELLKMWLRNDICNCSLGKRFRESWLQLNLSMGQNCSKCWDTFPRLSGDKNIHTNRQQWTLCAIQILPLTLCWLHFCWQSFLIQEGENLGKKGLVWCACNDTTALISVL